MKFCVITSGEQLPHFARLAEVLGSVFTLDRDSAAIRARHCWGIISSDLDESAAGILIKKCAALGLETIKLPSASVLLLPAITINKIAFEPGRFSWTGAPAHSGTSAAGDILVLSAAPVKEETKRTVKITEGPSGREKAIRLGIMAVSGLPIGMGKSREVNKEVTGSELSLHMDIVLRGDKIRLRINPEHFDFSCLKEKKTYSSQVNFRLLCAELSAFAPEALKNTGLRTMLDNKPLSALGYDTVEDLEKETSRLTALAYGH